MTEVYARGVEFESLEDYLAAMEAREQYRLCDVSTLKSLHSVPDQFKLFLNELAKGE